VYHQENEQAEVATRDLFDKAQKCILLLMQTDSLTAFFRSPLYRRHLKDKEEGVSLSLSLSLPPSLICF
jgi:hypothetical protein